MLRARQWLGAIILASVIIWPVVSGQAKGYISQEVSLSTAEMRALAEAVTVRIISPHASGSGVLLARNLEQYTLLTNWHVVAFSDQFTILTSDGVEHNHTEEIRQVAGVDLALMEFASPNIYPTVTLSHQSVTAGDPVYVAGFPMFPPSSAETTLALGNQIFSFTVGSVTLLLPQPLRDGYQLGYTNTVVMGMSGGPILNSQGYLVGINGRIKDRDPAFGVYRYADGTQPPAALQAAMSQVNWGIPIVPYLGLEDLSIGAPSASPMAQRSSLCQLTTN